MRNNAVHRPAAALLAACVTFALAPLSSPAADPAPESRLLDAFTARPLGPANMGGRVVDVAVVEGRPTTLYVATASGGLWKTVNNGITWTPTFDQQSTVSIGDVAVAPSNPDIVWVGTGEANPRNSVSWGDGLYKSTDGGKTWTHLDDLRDTHHIGRILIHPKDPDTVYVAAMGHFWGPNRQRGLYKTTDGGKTWRLSKFLNEDTGFIDLAMDPGDPETLYAAAYAVRRDGFSGGNPAKQYGPDSGLYKTTDGGKTWDKLTKGLPDGPLGRCGLDIYRKDPHILYAVIQTEKTRMVRAEELGQAGKTSDKVEDGGVFRSDDKGKSWTKLNDLCPRPFYFGQIRVDPADDKRVYVLGVSLHLSTDGGKTFRSGAAAGVHADHHALWIDPADPAHLVIGCDGGLSFSYDRGANWQHVVNLPIGQFYGAAVDFRKPYRVYGGLQDNGTWGGPSATRSPDGVSAADWFRILGGDGFQCQVDPTDPDTVYAESQYGGLTRVNVRSGDSRDIKPTSAKDAPAYRFNWSSPILISPHNPRTLYYGGDHLFRSLNRGEQWEEISPDLTHGKPGPAADFGHTLTTIAESPLKPGLVYVGSDDGKVQVTRNGGVSWTDVSDRIPGVASERWVTRLECSRFAEGTAYLALDRHRNDDLAPYLFVTTDYGASWKSLAGTLPAEGPVYVIREDPRNRNLLFAGTEFALFASFDRGATWHRFRAGLPTVAIHDLVVHPRDRELVIATHGRGLWVLDVAPLEELTNKVLASAAHLFEVKPATAFQPRGDRGLTTAGVFAAPNPAFGAAIHYYFKERPTHPVRLIIADALGNPVAVLNGTEEAGLHRVVWNLRSSVAGSPADVRVLVAPGDYAVRLEVGEKVVNTRKVRVEAEE
jgi:photosystem II stability/assembly factor-like uncharacterized protein